MQKDDVQEKIEPYKQSFTTMLPTNLVRRLRTNILWQFFRFIVLNIKMLLVVKKSH